MSNRFKFLKWFFFPSEYNNWKKKIDIEFADKLRMLTYENEKALIGRHIDPFIKVYVPHEFDPYPTLNQEPQTKKEANIIRLWGEISDPNLRVDDFKHMISQKLAKMLVDEGYISVIQHGRTYEFFIRTIN